MCRMFFSGFVIHPSILFEQELRTHEAVLFRFKNWTNKTILPSLSELFFLLKTKRCLISFLMYKSARKWFPWNNKNIYLDLNMLSSDDMALCGSDIVINIYSHKYVKWPVEITSVTGHSSAFCPSSLFPIRLIPTFSIVS